MTGRERNSIASSRIDTPAEGAGLQATTAGSDMASHRQAPGPDGTLGGLGLCPIAAEEKPVAEVLTAVAFRQLVQEQVAAADIALLHRGEGRDDEAVADVDVELVPRPSAGRV